MNSSNNNPSNNDENETISSGSSSHPQSGVSHLTRPELLRRRLHNTRRLSRYYRDMYWLLMNQLRFLLRSVYTSETGLSPFQEDQEPDVVVADNFNHKCASADCEKKPMALTTFCFAHILSDPRQVLYKPCEFVLPSGAQGGAGAGAEAIRCGKPINRWTVPSYCVGHIQMADHVPLTSSSSSSSSNGHKRKKED